MTVTVHTSSGWEFRIESSTSGDPEEMMREWRKYDVVSFYGPALGHVVYSKDIVGITVSK